MKKLLGFIMVLTLAVGLLAGLPQDSKDKQKGKGKQPVPPPPPPKVYIPQPVKAVMEEGLITREARQDIPFTIFRNYFFPAAQNLHAVFLFKVKNVDLGFAPFTPPAPPIPPADVPKAQETKTADQAAPPPPADQAVPPQSALLQAKLNVFLQFHLMENGAPGTLVREVYVPVALQEDPATYNPDQEQWYSTGYPLAPGKYILSMALTSIDLKKIGVAYYEFTVFDRAENEKELEMSPVVLVADNKFEIMDAPETVVTVHKGCFTYSKVRIVPKLENTIVPGENLQLFYFVFGTASNDQQKSDLEFTYSVDQDGKPAIRWSPQNSDVAIVFQDLPMKQTVLVKNGKEERREQRDLPAGKYVLNIQVKDKVTGNLGEKNIEFEVK
jgi:hypothetical protein